MGEWLTRSRSEESWQMALPGLSPLLLLKVSIVLSTIPASSHPHHNDLIKTLCEWALQFCLAELSISFLFPDYNPQQTPYLPYGWPPIWVHLAPDIGSKRNKRQSPGEDLGLPRFPKPHYLPVIGQVIGSVRASPVVSSSKFCLGFYVSEGTFPASSEMLLLRCFLTSKGRSRVSLSRGFFQK